MKSYYTLGLIFVLILLPSTTKAFEVIDKKAFDLGFAQLFMIEFEFGYLNADTLLPMFTTQTDVSFEFSRDGEILNGGQSTALFLSDVPVDNDFYRIKERERDTVTLLAIYQNESESARTLSVTNFSHYIVKDGSVRLMTARPEQIKNYQTSIDQPEDSLENRMMN